MRVTGNAKINLSLNIVGQRDLHLLDMVVVSISHADTVTISKRNDNKIVIRASCDEDIKPLVKQSALNVATQLFLPTQAQAITQSSPTCGVNIYVRKHVLKYGGIGGSGTVAAAIFCGWGKLLNHDVRSAEGQLRAFKWGSDLPALITGGFMRVKGCGEIVEKLGDFPTYYFVLAADNSSVSTSQSFALFDKMYKQNPAQFAPHTANNDRLIEALRAADYNGILRYSGNMLYPPSCAINPSINRTLACLRNSGALVCGMSGSGATCYGMYKSRATAEAAQQHLCGLGLAAVCAQSLNSVD